MLLVTRPAPPGVWLMRMPAVVLPLATTVPLLIGMGVPGVPVTLTEPRPLTSMPCWAFPVNSVWAPAGLLMFAAPPWVRMPSAFAPPAPAPLTTTPAPTVNVPAVTRMPSPSVFWMVRFEMLEVNVAVPGETWIAMPPVTAWLFPSRTSGAPAPPVVPGGVLVRRKPAGLFTPGVAVASVIVIGPPVVVSVVLVGRMMGRVSPADRPVVDPEVPMMMIWLPANGTAGIWAIAWVMVLYAQPGATLAPDMSLPVAVKSLPFAGSTYHLLPLAALQAEQTWPTQAVPAAPQSPSTQQSPATQLAPQQKSAPLALQALLLGLQAAVTHLPVVVLQMSPLP